MSTGIGRGIALPHPRNPIPVGGATVGDASVDGKPSATPPQPALPLVALAFPSEPIDWNTQDGSKVHTVFLLVSISAKQHLDTLSEINFLCQQEKFYSLITNRASKEKIIEAIQKAEKAWTQTSK
jgi:PTS system nitrogen regulatory IIA component